MTKVATKSWEAIAPGVEWWICVCGRHVDRHSQRSIVGGGKEIVCGRTESGRFECADKRFDYGYGGLVRK